MGIAHWIADRRARPAALADFDSATTLCRALAWFLDGREFPMSGVAPRAAGPVLPIANQLPLSVRQRLYQVAVATEAIDPQALSDVDLEAIRRWVVAQYPEREYPAVLVGSANGAAVHLAALLGVPWLPQTFLLPVRRTIDPDDPRADFEWGKAAAAPLLEANPDLTLHHTHDPNRDRLSAGLLASFRVKSLRLGPAYEQFLASVLPSDGTVLLLECEQDWPVTTVDDRHVFQFGAPGGLTPAEYHEGSPRVARFLERQGAARRSWDPPAPTGRAPEAEWGFDPALGEDVTRVADRRDWRVRRLSVDTVHDLSPLVAAFYRDHYERVGQPTDRLVAQSVAQVEPWWTVRTGSVPYWLPFTTEPEAAALESYLDAATPYDEIYVSLFSHGVESAGLASAERWLSIANRARERGAFLGTDPDAYPADFGTYQRYDTEFPETIPDRFPLPAPVPLERFEAFVEQWPGDEVAILDRRDRATPA